MAASLCTRISEKHALGAAVSILHNERNLFLAWANPQEKHSLKIVDDFSWPLWKSAAGLVLSALEGKCVFMRRIGAALREAGRADLSAAALYRQVRDQLREREFYVYVDETGRPHSAARPFRWEDRDVAVALFSPARPLPRGKARDLLEQAVRAFEDAAAR